jgi:hypothetical protein
MRRLSALVMLLGALTAALGVAAVVGIERIDLPPSAVRVIAAALPYTVLVVGVAMLVLGTVMARLALREAERSSARGLGGVADAAALGAGAPPDRPGQADRRVAAKRGAAPGEPAG